MSKEQASNRSDWTLHVGAEKETGGTAYARANETTAHSCQDVSIV